MKKIMYRFLSCMTAVIVIASCSIFASAGEEQSSNEFQYYSRVTSGDEYYGYEYDDSWFTESSSGYDVDRARISIRMALAASRTSTKSIKLFFDGLGMSYEDAYVKFPTPKYDYEGKTTTIGYAIGSKKIKDEEGNTIDLVAVAVRSAGYKAEWGSNFKIGTAEEHEGFRAASDKVSAEVSEYIEKLGSDHVKVWISGFSRGAAVGNLCAHQFNEWAESGECAYLDSADDIYAYCFECPRLVKSSGVSGFEKETNIINVVNSVDLVTKIAPQKWGYERYGEDYYIPTKAYVSDFDSYMNGQVGEYIKIINKTKAAAVYPASVIEEKARDLSTPAEDQVSSTGRIANAWADCFESQEKYCAEYEKTMAQIASAWQGSAENTAALIEAIPNLKDKHPLIYDTLLAEGTVIYQAHLPEYTLSWIDSLDSVSDFVSPEYRKLMIEGPAEISIVNAGGDRADVETYTDENGVKTFVIPCDGEYTAKITAAEEGSLSYEVLEWNDASYEAERVLIYDSISIKEGDVLTGSIDNISSGERAEYELKDAEGVKIIPTRDYEGDEDKEYSLEVVTGGDGEGKATGSGTYLNGEYVKLKAQSDYDSFEGWYQDGKKLSGDIEYWLRITEDMTVTGVFTAHAHETGDRIIKKATLKKDGRIKSAKCSICGKTIAETVIPAVENIDVTASGNTFDVIVMDREGNTLENGTDYTVKYDSEKKNAKKHKVTVKGKGLYSFTENLSFTD